MPIFNISIEVWSMLITNIVSFSMHSFHCDCTFTKLNVYSCGVTLLLSCLGFWIFSSASLAIFISIKMKGCAIIFAHMLIVLKCICTATYVCAVTWLCSIFRQQLHHWIFFSSKKMLTNKAMHAPKWKMELLLNPSIRNPSASTLYPVSESNHGLKQIHYVRVIKLHCLLLDN